MDVKKTIKKVIALGTGATMVGATIVGAMAADLSDYPAPFIKKVDGKPVFDALLVLGDKAAAADVLGAIDISNSLAYSMVEESTVSTGGTSATVTVEGDAWAAETSTKKLELGESFANIQSVISEGDLNALADGTIKAKNSVEYYQELRFTGNIKLVYEEDTDNDIVGDFLHINNNERMMIYRLIFKSALETDIVSAELEDLEDKKLTLLGSEYTITDTDYASDGKLTITLMTGAIEDTLSELETKTYTINEQDYKVKVDWLEGTHVTFVINDEATDKMTDGDTYELADGTQVGVRDIYDSEAGDITPDRVRFYLGANKIELYDSDAEADSNVDGRMTVGDERMDEVVVGLKGTNSSGDYLFEWLQLNYTADDDYWLAPGEKLSSKVNEPEGFINWDVTYEGLITPSSTEDIKLVPSGDEEYDLKVTLTDGEVKIPIAYSADATHLRLGDRSDNLSIARTEMPDDTYFFVTTGSGTPADGDKSFMLQYKGADSASGDTIAQVSIKNLATSETEQYPLSISSGSGTFTMGGTEFTVKSANGTASCTAGKDDFTINITGGSTRGYLVTEGNALIRIVDEDETSDSFTNTSGYGELNVSVVELDTDMIENATTTTILMKISGGAADEIGVDTPALTTSLGGTRTLITDPDDSDIKTQMTMYGAIITHTVISNSPNKVDIVWPSEQRIGQGFVTSGVITTSTAEGATAGTITTQKIYKIDVGAAKLASEVEGNEKDNNMILVGGPAINNAAYVWLGKPADAQTGFEVGKAKIKLMEDATTGKVAMLVAGWSAVDTRAAAQFVAKYADKQATFSEADDEIVLTVSSLTDVVATIPTAAATTTNTTS